MIILTLPCPHPEHSERISQIDGVAPRHSTLLLARPLRQGGRGGGPPLNEVRALILTLSVAEGEESPQTKFVRSF